MRLIAVVKHDVRYAVGVVVMAVAVSVLAVVQFVFLNACVVGVRDFGFKVDLLFLFALYFLMVVGHEAFHVVSMRLLGVKVLGLSVLKVLRVFPVGVSVMYDEMELGEYMVVLLAPQVISVFLLAAAVVCANIVVDSWLYSGRLFYLLYLLYFLHLAVSSGDFYGIVYTLVKARTLKGFWKAVVEKEASGKICVRKYMLYVED